MIAILDYDAGNIKSVEKAMQLLGQEVTITRDRETVLGAEKVILPGVGAFGDAMGKIHQYGLFDVIHKVVDRGTPFLGICLGLQLLFERSDESPHPLLSDNKNVRNTHKIPGEDPGTVSRHYEIPENSIPYAES